MRDFNYHIFANQACQILTPQDHAFFAMMYKFAQKYNVKNILTGANIQQNASEIQLIDVLSVRCCSVERCSKRFGSIKLKTFPTTNILNHKLYCHTSKISEYLDLKLYRIY